MSGAPPPPGDFYAKAPLPQSGYASPPPTPEPPKSRGEASDIARGLSFVVGIFIGLTAIKLGMGEEITAYSMGRSLGVAIGALLISCGIRWVYLRVTSSSGPIVTPITLLTAVAIALPTVVFADDKGEAPSQEDVTAAFAPVTGYQYAEVPRESLDVARQFLSNSEEGDVIETFDARSVTVNDRPVAAVIIFSIDPDELDGDYREEFSSGFQAATGSPPEELPIGDETGYVFAPPQGGAGITFFDDDGLIFMVQSVTRDSAIAIATELQRANSD